MATPELFESGEHDLISINSDEEEKCWINTKNIDIWKDENCMKLLQEGITPDIVDLEKCKKTNKRILNYH